VEGATGPTGYHQVIPLFFDNSQARNPLHRHRLLQCRPNHTLTRKQAIDSYSMKTVTAREATNAARSAARAHCASRRMAAPPLPTATHRCTMHTESDTLILKAGLNALALHGRAAHTRGKRLYRPSVLPEADVETLPQLRQQFSSAGGRQHRCVSSHALPATTAGRHAAPEQHAPWE
jgi:hypothetical protein